MPGGAERTIQGGRVRLDAEAPRNLTVVFANGTGQVDQRAGGVEEDHGGVGWHLFFTVAPARRIGNSPAADFQGDAIAWPTANQPASMSTELSDTISTLNKLIETCKDGQEGFRLAAEAIADDEDLKGFLFSCSLQRSKFAGELQNEVIALGEPGPSEESTLVSGLHRGWINLKTALTGNDNHAILAECERGEDSAVADYRKALNASLSETFKEIVRRQLQEIVATHNSVRGLRDELAAQKPATRSAGQVASDFGSSLREKSGALGNSAAETWTGAMQSTEVYVRENPFPAILTALGIGFGLGLLVRLFERPDRETIQVPIPKTVQKVRDYDYQAAVLPFLWPVAKFFMSNYASARRGVAKAYDQASDVDVSKYVDPVVKRAKKMF